MADAASCDPERGDQAVAVARARADEVAVLDEAADAGSKAVAEAAGGAVARRVVGALGEREGVTGRRALRDEEQEGARHGAEDARDDRRRPRPGAKGEPPEDRPERDG